VDVPTPAARHLSARSISLGAEFEDKNSGQGLPRTLPRSAHAVRDRLYRANASPSPEGIILLRPYRMAQV
jgi:hypothetical protein